MPPPPDKVQISEPTPHNLCAFEQCARTGLEPLCRCVVSSTPTTPGEGVGECVCCCVVQPPIRRQAKQRTSIRMRICVRVCVVVRATRQLPHAYDDSITLAKYINRIKAHKSNRYTCTAAGALRQPPPLPPPLSCLSRLIRRCGPKRRVLHKYSSELSWERLTAAAAATAACGGVCRLRLSNWRIFICVLRAR